MAKSSNSPDLSALADAAASSPFDLLAEQAKQELLLERNSRGLDALARALEAQGNAGFLQRMYAAGLQADAYRNRMAAVVPAAQRAYLATAAGQQGYQEAGRQDLAAANKSDLQRQQAELNARRMAGPDYQAAAFAKAAASLAEGLNRARAASVAAGAESAYRQTPQGQAVAGAASLERAAAASAESLNRFGASAIDAAARLSYIRTPEGQKQYAEQGRQQDLANAADALTRQRQARLESARQQTPEYQRSTTERAAAASLESLNELRARVALQQAEAARARTPEGKAEARERQTLERRAGHLDQASRGRDGGGVERQLIAANLAAALPFGLGRIVQAGTGAAPMFKYAANPENPGMMRAGAALAGIVPVAGALVGAFRAATSTVAGFAGAVSPSATSTFNSSLELLSAKIGHSFVPLLDDASRALQKWGDWYEKSIGEPMARAQKRNQEQGNWWDQHTGALWVAEKLGFADPKNPYGAPTDIARDVVLPGVHAKTGRGDFGQARMDIQQASLESGGKQAQLLVLQEILKEMQKDGNLLKTLEQHAATTRYGFGY